MTDWQVAPLFSAAGIETNRQARDRATAALLAITPLVPGFAAALLQSVGVRLDGRSAIETYIDVALGTGRAPRADGAIRVSRGRSDWTAAVLVRTGQDKLTPAVVKRARDASAKAGFDAVITVTNDAAGPDLGRSRSKVAVHHWPWASIVATAVDEKVRDDEQAHLLGELVRFVGTPEAKVLTLGDMGPSWSAVVKTARTSRLSARDAGVVDVGRRWDQVVRQVAVSLSRTSGHDVQQVLAAAKARDAEKRLADVVNGLVQNGQLDGVLRVADSAGDLALVADLVGRRLVSVVVVRPPAGLGARATAGWLLDGLDRAPGDVVVESWSSSGRQPLAVATVRDLKRDMSLLEGSRGRLGDSYRVLLADEMPTARSSFSDALEVLAERTWTEVLAPLSGVQPTSPRTSTRSAPKKPARPKKTSSKRSSRSDLPASRSGRSTRASGKSKRAADLARELRRDG